MPRYLTDRVAVMEGEQGVAWSEAGQTDCLAAQPVSTYGAGDCFAGALCQRLRAGVTQAEANRAAAEHVS